MKVIDYLELILFGFKKNIRRSSKYLINGKYIMSDNFQKIYNQKFNKNDNMYIYNNKVSQKIKIQKFTDKLITKKLYEVNTDEKIIEGEFIVISTSRNQFKVFDLKNKKVATFFKKKQEYQDVINNYNKIKNIYNIPKKIEYNTKEICTIEEYIEDNKKSVDKEILFDLLIKDYIKMASKKDIRKFKCNINEKIKKNKTIQNICNKIKFVEEINELRIISHGDVWFSNLIYNKKIFYVDFENVDYYNIYYDIFFFMYSEAYIFNNYTLLKNYLKGNYDEDLKKYFSIFEIEYNKNMKNEYLLLFLYEFANNKVKIINKKYIGIMINQIEKVLKELNIDIGDN